MKSKQELIEEWESAIEDAEFYGKGKEERLISYMKDFVSDLNQLDEPETLSQEWIDDHKHYYPVTAFNNSAKEIVDVEDLQNLLVPKKMNILEIEAMLDDIGWWDSSTEEQVIVMAIEKGEIGHDGKQYKVVEVSKEEQRL